MLEIDINLEKPQLLCAMPAFHPSQQRTSAWKHGPLTLPTLLLVKTTGSTHFPVFFCQLWEKALISFLPPRRWLWRPCEKPVLRATAPRRIPSPQSEPLSPLSVNSDVFREQEARNCCFISWTVSDGVNIDRYIGICLPRVESTTIP